MFGIISSGTNAIALLQARMAMARNKTATSSAMPKDAAKTEAEKAAAEKVRRAQDALDALKQNNAVRKQQRKAAAREKIERLKKELEMLRMSGGLGDPKAIARRAKQIARELGAAAKEYAAAGGGGGGGGVTSSEPVSAGSDGAAAQADAAAAQAGGAGQDGSAAGGKEAPAQNAGAEVKDAEVKDTGAKPDEPTAVGAKAAQAEAKAEALVAKTGEHDEKHGTKPVERTPEQERQATVQAFQKAVSGMVAKSNEDIADSKFAADVRNLYQQVKAIMEQQRRRAKLQGTDDEEMERLSKQVADMGSDIETSLSGGDAAEVMMPVNLQV